LDKFNQTHTLNESFTKKEKSEIQPIVSQSAPEKAEKKSDNKKH